MTGPAERTEVVLTYHLFDIVWDNGGTWTGYDTAENALRVAESVPDRSGTIRERRFEERFRPGSSLLRIARANGKAIAERTEVVALPVPFRTNRSSSTPAQPKD